MARKMPAVDKNHLGRRLPLPYRICSLVAVLLLLLVAASTLFALTRASKAARASTPSFGFSVTGDYDQTTHTTNTLRAIGQLYSAKQIAFHLGLGDFSYVSNPNAAQ